MAARLSDGGMSLGARCDARRRKCLLNRAQCKSRAAVSPRVSQVDLAIDLVPFEVADELIGHTNLLLE